MKLEEDGSFRYGYDVDRMNHLSDTFAYVVINAFLIGVWAVTGAGYFWPGWVLAGWGVGLFAQGGLLAVEAHADAPQGQD